MKNFKFILTCFTMLLFFAASTASAQISKRTVVTADTLVNTDTLYITSDDVIDGVDFHIQPTVRKISGTLAGKVYYYHSLNGIDYVLLDSTSLSNIDKVSAIKTYTAPAVRYRLQYITSGTTRAIAEVTWTRRRKP